jgi:hypothetical protein
LLYPGLWGELKACAIRSHGPRSSTRERTAMHDLLEDVEFWHCRVFGSASAEQCQVLGLENTTKTKDARPRCRRNVRATEKVARQGVRMQMQMRPAMVHAREAALPAAPNSGVFGGETGLHRFPSRRSFANMVRTEGGAEMRTRRRPTFRTSVHERSRLLPRADPRGRGSPRMQMCMQLLLLLLRRLLRKVCSAT